MSFLSSLCSTEGCTCWFDGNWKECCDMHDRRYSNNRITRRQADRLLYRCVAKKNKPMALIMYIGVRVLGWTRYKGE